MNRPILALDLGTTSCRALILDQTGAILAWSQRAFTQYFPKPGYVEHDPVEIFECQCAVAKEAMEKAHLSGSQIAGIGISNQRETSLIWDRQTGKPFGRAIVWQDRRTAALCQSLKEHEPLVQAKTGLLIDPYFSATKIYALLDEHAQAIKGRSVLFGTLETWLIYQLTEGRVHITDMTNASRTLLFNIHTLTWDEELLTLFKIPRDILPEVKSCAEVYGTTRLLGGEIPICGAMGDQQASLFGQSVFSSGIAKCTYGTGAFLLMHTGKEAHLSRHRLLTTIAASIQGEVTYALEGSHFIAGAAVGWLQEALHMIDQPADIEKLAASVTESGGVVFIPSFTGLGAPYWDPLAKGALLGLTRGTNRGHIARALLEGIAFSIQDILTAMQKDSGMALKQLRVDGGASHNRLLMQIQSDVSQIPLLRPRHIEASSLGAAMLAGLTSGVWPNLASFKNLWQLDESFSPQINLDMTAWQRAVNAVRTFHE